MTRVKICGLTNEEDALAAIEMGADAVGFVLAPSPRQVSPDQAARIVAGLPPLVCKVGVFVDCALNEVTDKMDFCGLNLAQLHGNESPDVCAALFPRAVKAFRVRDESILDVIPHYRVSAYLLDTYHAILHGGTGTRFDWSIARKACRYGPIILSGGLTPENVAQAIGYVGPYAVDVSSGVESRPGIKDHARLRSFLEQARAQDAASHRYSPATASGGNLEAFG